MEAAVDCLGVRGARVLLFGRALRRLEQKTNEVLQQLGIAIRIAIMDRREQQNGKTVDALSIQLTGQQGGGRYEGLSSGERTRVDVALLLGLASLGQQGVMFFDEVFDTLDQDGVERVAAYLAEMGHATSGQPIVISHSADLVSLFPRSTVWRARKGDAGSTGMESESAAASLGNPDRTYSR